MNKQRRKEINKAHDLLDDAVIILELALSEEIDAKENLPENLQASSRGEEMENNISDLENALSSLEEADESLEGVIKK